MKNIVSVVLAASLSIFLTLRAEAKTEAADSAQITQMIWFSHHLCPSCGETQVEWMGTHDGRSGVYVVLASPNGVRFACFNTNKSSLVLKPSDLSKEGAKFFGSSLSMKMGGESLPAENAVYVTQASTGSNGSESKDFITATYSKNAAPLFLRSLISNYSKG